MSNGEMLKEIRKRTGLSQKNFAFLFDIPIGTYRNWEQGRVDLPDYLYNMIHRLVSETEEDICQNLDDDQTLAEGWMEFFTGYYLNNR